MRSRWSSILLMVLMCVSVVTWNVIQPLAGWSQSSVDRTAMADQLGSMSVIAQASSQKTFTVPPLPYAYDALNSYIDTQTMTIHHDKHHGAYVSKLNAAIAKYPSWEGKPVEELLTNLNKIPADIRTTVRNNGGGHANHTLFWESMAPKAGGVPKGEIATAINQTFGSFEKFKAAFKKAGVNQFGSGWAWLVLTKAGKLEVTSTPNQDSPLFEGNTPLLGNDVWEHAYYLKYQNRRADYLDAWWNVVNWDKVNTRYKEAQSP
ncbi:MAG: superoxide dismutase [Acaryochloridaceae cyanobacterium CSU_3_4]|nr:superoxide dismutase [Acaryochloridaceae cyanobacterium CSU_3_4]